MNAELIKKIYKIYNIKIKDMKNSRKSRLPSTTPWLHFPSTWNSRKRFEHRPCLQIQKPKVHRPCCRYLRLGVRPWRLPTSPTNFSSILDTCDEIIQLFEAQALQTLAVSKNGAQHLEKYAQYGCQHKLVPERDTFGIFWLNSPMKYEYKDGKLEMEPNRFYTDETNTPEENLGKTIFRSRNRWDFFRSTWGYALLSGSWAG